MSTDFEELEKEEEERSHNVRKKVENRKLGEAHGTPLAATSQGQLMMGMALLTPAQKTTVLT